MRAVALSDTNVKRTISEHFVPLKITIAYGAEQIPLDWPAFKGWRTVYSIMGGSKNTGFTGCSVVTPDTQQELASTGSAHVWEMFDSLAYDAKKFLKGTPGNDFRRLGLPHAEVIFKSLG
jgi:hypothetical protein